MKPVSCPHAIRHRLWNTNLVSQDMSHHLRSSQNNEYSFKTSIDVFKTSRLRRFFTPKPVRLLLAINRQNPYRYFNLFGPQEDMRQWLRR